MKNIIKDLVYEALNQGLSDDTRILETVSLGLEDEYFVDRPEKMEETLNRMGIRTTGDLKDAIKLCKMQYTVEHRNLVL